MRDLQLNHLRLLLLMASIASAMLLPAWALYDLRRIVLVLESVSVFSLQIPIYLHNSFENFAFQNHSLLYSLDSATFPHPVLQLYVSFSPRRGFKGGGGGCTCFFPEQQLVIKPMPFTTSSDLYQRFFLEPHDFTSNIQHEISCLQLTL